MTFAKLCGSEFYASARERGREYLVEKRVKDLALNLAGATATVTTDSGSFKVSLSFEYRDKGGMSARCECLNYKEGTFCQHIWATLLALDEHYQVQMPAGRHIILIHDDAVDAQGIPYPELFPAQTTSYEITRRDGGSLSSDRPSANWTRILQQLAQRSPAPRQPDFSRQGTATRKAIQRQIWYVVNVAECQQSQRLAIDLYHCRRLKTGEWSTAKRMAIKRDDIARLASEEDRWLLALMLGNEAVPGDHGYEANGYLGSGETGYSRCFISPGMYEMLLPRLAATGRFVSLLHSNLPVERGQPLAWDDGPPWQCQVHMETNEAAGQWQLLAEFQRGDQRRPLKQALVIFPEQLVLFEKDLARFEVGENLHWLQLLQSHGSMVIPFQDRSEWLNRFLSLPQVPALELPGSLQVAQVTSEPRPRLEIKPANGQYYLRKGDLCGWVSFLYGDKPIAIDDKTSGHFDEVSNSYLLRNRQKERELLDRLRQLGCADHEYRRYYTAAPDFVLSDKKVPDLVRALVAEGWLVETEGIRLRSAGEFKLEVNTSVDWFELNGKVDFDGVEISLPALLAAVRKNESFIQLDDGSQGVLPEAWLKKYGKIAQLASAEGDILRFSASQALLLDALLAEQEHVHVDQGFRDYQHKLRAFSGVAPAVPPNSFCGELRHYQQDGLGWLHFLRDFRFGGCLADDMGLGKTVQVLALLETRRTRELAADEPRRPSMVVVPKSLVFNWIEEARHFTPQLRVLNFTGIERGDSFLQTDSYDLLVTTYGTLRRDFVKLKDVEFDYAILDESQAIKNANSQAAKACRLIRAQHRLAMTGTPVENHLGELWSLFDFLNPGMLGRSSVFASLARTSRDYDSESLKMLAQAIRPFLLRRTKEQVLTELPEKSEQTLYCELSSKERKAYDELRDYFRTQLTDKVRTKGLAQSKIHVLEALLRLRQAACHPGLLDKKRTGELSAKLQTLLEQVQEIVEEGHKALVFSQFTSLLAIVRQQLDQRGIVYEYLDGQTSNRGERVKRFQADVKCPLFLISLKAGGHGLNLTAADYVFILDPWWNPAVEAQAVDRAHRIGQTRHVFAYRLIARDTVEDKILELQKSKRDLADAIVSADDSLIRNLTTEDLELLLS